MRCAHSAGVHQHDPDDRGQQQQWFDPRFKDDNWQILPEARPDQIDPQRLATARGVVWFRSRFTVPDDFGARKHLWLMFGAERLNPEAEMSVYLDGKLVREQTAAAKKRPLLPMDFPFHVDVKAADQPGADHDLAIKVRYLRQRLGRTFEPVALVSTNIDLYQPTEGGLIVLHGALQEQRHR